jgi:hypothetical protein
MKESAKIEETVDNIKEYVQTRYELITLQASDRISDATSEILSKLLIALVVIIAFLLLSFAAAIYLSSAIGRDYSGFLIVGGAYFVIGVIMVLVRKKLIAGPLRDKMIKALFKD